MGVVQEKEIDVVRVQRYSPAVSNQVDAEGMGVLSIPPPLIHHAESRRRRQCIGDSGCSDVSVF